MSIGIYKITNKHNNKVYIGQSIDCERRKSEHFQERFVPIDYIINVLGKENFSFEILEECKETELDDKEKFYIDKYKSIENGYNKARGGNNNSKGEGNGRACLTEEDVIQIRLDYNNHVRQKDSYERFKNKVTLSQFQSVWQGISWSHVMPEVFTEENKNYYVKQSCVGENSPNAVFTNEEVLELRKMYVNKSAREIFNELNLQEKTKFSTLNRILCGKGYTKDIPVYKKKEKQWYLNGKPVSTILGSEE